MERRIWTIIALIAGFFIGKNWDKIRKTTKPYVETATQKVIGGTEEAKKFLEEQKEKVVSRAQPRARKRRRPKAATASK